MSLACLVDCVELFNDVTGVCLFSCLLLYYLVFLFFGERCWGQNFSSKNMKHMQNNENTAKHKDTS